MKFTAFILGLTAFGLVSADVSHLAKNQQSGHHHNSFNNGGQQIVMKQAFMNNAFTGNTQNTPQKRYWWMNTETLPFTSNNQPQNSRNHVDNLAIASSSIECKRCASSSVQLKRSHNTHNSDPYSHNPFMKGRYITRQPTNNQNSIHTHSAQIAGSPSEVNNYFGAAKNFQSSRLQQQQQSCDANSACVAPRFCFNGIIDQSYENQVPRNAVSSPTLVVVYTTLLAFCESGYIKKGRNLHFLTSG